MRQFKKKKRKREFIKTRGSFKRNGVLIYSVLKKRCDKKLLFIYFFILLVILKREKNSRDYINGDKD